MIYTVTFNPALDYIVRLDSFAAGGINRVNYEQVLGGGKGINVSIVLANMGIKSTALGFIAGFTGEEIKRQLITQNVDFDFVQLPEGFTRINVKVKADVETEINGQGPNISEAKQQELFDQLDKLQEGDTLVLAGSIPNTLPDDIYERIMERLHGKGIRIIVDATKKLLMNVLKYNPFLIKPNNHELGEMFGVTLKTDEEIITYAKKLQEQGAQNVLISMAGDGAINRVSYEQVLAGGKGINVTIVLHNLGHESTALGFVAGFTGAEIEHKL
ncbi:MAG: hexose kinase, partial [Selenomonadaceae bacterium]|nr:hexose kinase [Selenomonadaceae bacterium]